MKDVVTIADALLAATSMAADEEAIVCEDRRLTYREVHEQVSRFANILLAYGVEQGSKIGVQIPRSPEYIIAYFAVTMTGAVVVPLDPNLTCRETASILDYCDVELLITNKQNLLSLERAVINRGRVKTLLLFGQSDQSLADQLTNPGGSFLRIGYVSELLERTPNKCNPVLVDPDSLALLLHTSGTMSSPKRVMLSHRNVISNAWSHIASVSLQHRDKALVALPMFFGYCNTAQMLAHILLGGTLVLLPGIFTPSRFCRLVQAEEITTSVCVPTMLLYLLNHDRLEDYDLSSLRQVCFGGSVMPYNRLVQLTKRLPSVGFVQTYGQTEASPRITTLLPDDMLRKPNSVGRAIPGVELFIFDESEVPLASNEIGEIVVRGQNVMLGYYKRPDATTEVIRDGYLFTGDLGYLDEEGYLYLVGRKKNVLIRGGINVYVEEVEEYLMQHPSVSQVCVISEGHSLQGEVPVALIVPAEHCSISTEDLIAYCKQGLAAHKIPVRFEIRTELLRTPTGKPKRYELIKDEI